MNPSIISFDIDLNRVHAWSSESGRVCYNAPISALPVAELPKHDVILIEVMSPVFYDKRPGVVHRTMAMALFNTYAATVLWTWQRATASSKTLLVAPSSAWTLGFPEDMRHEVAGVTGDNHDIREARCMQFFYGRNPEKWVPFETYFNGFTFKDSDAVKTKKAAAKLRKEKRCVS